MFFFIFVNIAIEKVFISFLQSRVLYYYKQKVSLMELCNKILGETGKIYIYQVISSQSLDIT